jgi:hypothetical protein
MIFRKSKATVQAPETIACTECGHIVLKSSATSVGGTYTAWYCRDHRPPYDERYDNLIFCSSDGLHTYYRRMRVNKEGIPIGYVKEPEGK